MYDIFISYSSSDALIARGVRLWFQQCGLQAFVARHDIKPGAQWSPVIWTALLQARRVLVLASRTACRSEFVNQEIGGAIAARKPIVPVTWDVRPEELPGWLKSFQALRLEHGEGGINLEGLRPIATAVQQEREQERQNKTAAGFVIGGLVALALMGSSSE